MLFAVWERDAYRSTRDLDLLGFGSPEPKDVETCFRDILGLDVPDDGLRFEPDSLTIRKVREENEYSGVEMHLEMLLGKARIPLKVDVGFGDVVVPEPEEVRFPPLLDGPAPHIRAYSRESVIAEKLHAAVLFKERNTRLKDFYELFVLSRFFPFEGAKITAAIAGTFDRRRTPLTGESPLPGAFFSDEARSQAWRGYLQRNELAATPRDFAEVGAALRRFLGPPFDALAAGSEFRASWQPGGPWR